jgi:hypothetical protein
MTDRYSYLTVALESGIRSDDAADLLRAIAMLKGVISVAPHVADAESWTAEMRVRAELHRKLWDVLKQ